MQVDIINDHLVYRPDNIDQHRVVFPELKVAEVRGQTYAAVPLSLANSQLLNNMGYTPPTPMRTAYKWPGRYKPYKHQLITAEFFALNRRAFCNNGLGTGKTLATLWAADYLMSIGAVQKCLIVSPLSTLECVWAKEIFINFPKRKSATLHGSRQKRLTLLNENVDFYIINHDGIGTIIEELRQRRDIDLIVIDELAVMRNAKTERFKTIKSLITPEKWAWGLTGTPTPNAPTDAYGQVKLIKPENFNGNFTKFKNITMVQISPFKWIARTGSEQVINQVMHPRIRYALEDCVDLPPTIYHEREAQLSPDQQKHFTKLQREAATEIDGKEVTAVNAAVLVSKLLQTACGVAYAGDERAKLDFGPRLNVLKECINEAKAKVIVFVPFPVTIEVDPVTLPLGGDAPVVTRASAGLSGVQPKMQLKHADGSAIGSFAVYSSSVGGGSLQDSGAAGTPNAAKDMYPSNLYADLSQATAATINQIRQAFQIQRLLERDARGGTRYVELLKSHFGVTSADARLQRPEYLGGGLTPVNIAPIAQTSGTANDPATGYSGTPAGSLSAVGTAVAHGHGFTHSFTEHGYVIGLISVRADLNYQQGLNRMWSRKTRYDFYWPVFAMLGEQAVLNKEIYCKGTQDANDELVFGYQERWAEYRYKPSLITGQLRSTFAQPLDIWHLAQKFTALPTLNDTFIQDTPPEVS